MLLFDLGFRWYFTNEEAIKTLKLLHFLFGLILVLIFFVCLIMRYCCFNLRQCHGIAAFRIELDKSDIFDFALLCYFGWRLSLHAELLNRFIVLKLKDLVLKGNQIAFFCTVFLYSTY